MFFCDLHAMLYQVTPREEAGGAAFHDAVINRLKEELGATYNVSIGASGGGTAGFYYGVKCAMDRIIAFGPVLEPEAWMARPARWAH